METKKKLAAVGVAAVVGAAGYGVYSTTLGVANAGTEFAAGTAAEGQIEGFGTVVIDAGPPVYNPKTGLYEFADLTITPTGYSDWSRVAGKQILVVGYAKDGSQVVSGQLAVPAGATTGPVTVPLTAGDANVITTWGIVVR